MATFEANLKPATARMTIDGEVTSEPRITNGALQFNFQGHPNTPEQLVVIKANSDLGVKWGETLEKGNAVMLSGKQHVLREQPNQVACFIADQGAILSNQATIESAQLTQERRQGMTL